jgi:hypothetical protein
MGMSKIPYNYPELKAKFLEMYGYVCACCGEINPKFLTLDHVQNDGGEKRSYIVMENWPGRSDPMPRMMHVSTGQFLRDAVSEYHPEEYRILCYNCNMARAHYGGICPHTEEDKSYIPSLRDMIDCRWKGKREQLRLREAWRREKKERIERSRNILRDYLVHFH